MCVDGAALNPAVGYNRKFVSWTLLESQMEKHASQFRGNET